MATYTDNKNVCMSIFAFNIETDTMLFEIYYILFELNIFLVKDMMCSSKGWT